MGQHKWQKEIEHPVNLLLTRQWETDGLCEKCLRNKYCSKRCSKRVALFESMILNRLREKGIPLFVPGGYK